MVSTITTSIEQRLYKFSHRLRSLAQIFARNFQIRRELKFT